MILRLILFIARRCDYRVIWSPDDNVYLIRYRIFGWLPGDKPCRFSLYLHRFMSEDEDRELHNHPWKWALSLILVGGYEEERFDGDGNVVSVTRRPWRINFLRGSTYHRVAELHGRETWTLFLAGPKASSWGFWVPGRGHVEWRKYLSEKGVEVPY